MSPFFELHSFPHFGSIMMAKERLAGMVPPDGVCCSAGCVLYGQLQEMPRFLWFVPFHWSIYALICPVSILTLFEPFLRLIFG